MSKIIRSKDEEHNYVVVTHITATVQRLVSGEGGEPSLTDISFLGFGVTEEDVQALSYALTENKFLQRLSLDHLNLSDDGAATLAQGLCYNQSLQYLSLRWNEIGDKGAHSIANALHYNQALKELVVSFNNISDKGAKAFALAMKRNQTLETLDLKWNKISDQYGDILLDSMEDNPSFTTLALGGNGTTLRNVGKQGAISTKSSKRSKSMKFLSGIGINVDKEDKGDKTVTIEQLRKSTAARTMTEQMIASEATMQEALPEVPPVIEQLPTEIKVNDVVQVKGTDTTQVRQGRVAYVGTTSFSEGLWVGVVFSEPVGKNDGSVRGVRYFTCPTNCGSFLRPEKLIVLMAAEDEEGDEQGFADGGDAMPPEQPEFADMEQPDLPEDME